MTLQVIGAGWARTGTTSMKQALETLGLPCHHMHEVFDHPEQADLFREAVKAGPDFEWERIYAGYSATVDWPGSVFWRELVAAYPEAKVLLTLRDPERWFTSYHATVYRPIALGLDDPSAEKWNAMAQEVVVQRLLAGEPHDRERLIAAFERHNEEVRTTVPADRLLVHHVGDGWEPLCAFLDLPVPAEPYPHLNDSGSWGKRAAE
ncbi:hypothetical protein SAMN05421678_109117 [Actinopolymorpha cephalotaxi]|uniref:Sulfotransferase family protein n=1 Tax=Actinopolymorpha cephalotaxi TaxID=504797 RepID=A0A1I2VFF7_9ACTN|nr:sulfotransferase family protein [Actinopolymorpha cephalotaxi]NYH84831.1 hypothetical protein [Actinopolymorpha cephalotaxi]SFG86917.1 hypothetical protein SAMN05421678_109117 [Actinopolymorpha cephalotaxi]